MAIPGYDPDDIEEFLLEREGDRTNARASVAAGTVPEAFALVESDAEAPEGALSDPVDVVGLEGLANLDAVQFALEYDPGALPDGPAEADVAVAVVTADGLEVLDSTVDREESRVSATVTERPRGDTVVAVCAVKRGP